MKYLIIDIDGTLSFTPEFKTFTEFQGLDHKKFKPKKLIIKYVQKLIKCREDIFPIFLTARCQSLEDNTIQWLNKNLHLEERKYRLSMRPLGCLLPAHYLKISILKKNKIKPKQVQLWIDDDEDVIVHAGIQGYNIIHPRIIENVIIDEFWEE